MRILCLLPLLAALTSQPAAAQGELAGTWRGMLQVDPETALTVDFVISAAPDGSYTAVLTSPDLGGIKDVAADGVTFTAGVLRVDVAALSGFYTGILRDGAIAGEWSQEGTALPLNLLPYEAPVLSQAELETLLGAWSGKLQLGGGGEITLVFRLDTDAQGGLTGVVEVPEDGTRVALGEITVVDGEVSLEVPQVRGLYAGRLMGEQITGTWRQGGGDPRPLVLTKGADRPLSDDLDLPQASRRQLAGRWRGTLESLPMVLVFEMDTQGRVRGFVNGPQGASGLPVTAATVVEGRLNLRVASIGAEYSGELQDDTITGNWTADGMSRPLTLRRQ